MPNGEFITVEITYVELLNYTFGKINFSYPGDYSLIQFAAIDTFAFNLNYVSERNLDDVNYTMDNSELQVIDSGINITSNTSFQRLDENIAIEFIVSTDDLVVIDYSTMVNDTLFDCSPDKSGYVSLILEPQSDSTTAVIQKNFTLVIDKSGSMIGEKIGQAKQAASFIVDNLNEGDFFNIISFSKDVNSLFGEHREKSEESVDQASSYINSIDAGGSTNISGSLIESIAEFDTVDDDKANIIIFFTDGQATTGITDTPGILAGVEGEVISKETEIFLFTFGIGAAVDKQLLTLLGKENNGLATFLEDNNLRETITNFFLQVNNPVLIGTQLSIFPQGVICELTPAIDNLPNLYKGEQLIVSGKYNNPQDVKLTLEGTAFNKDVKVEFDVLLSDTISADRSFLPKLWAKQKIDELTENFNIANTDSEKNAIQEEIDNISRCFNVVSLDFNSFVDGTVLSVELLDFTGQEIDDQKVSLEWVTVGELNNKVFEIEHSTDFENWNKLGEVAGSLTTSERNVYSFVDKLPSIGINYYRLKQVDVNGVFSYSKVVAVQIDAISNIKLVSNLLSVGQAINIQNQEESELTIHLIDMSGKLISRTLSPARFTEIPTVGLAAGAYLVHIQAGNTVLTEKIILK